MIVEIHAVRRPRTEFAPVRIALDWTRTHVPGVDVGPSEVTCRVCRRWLMPLTPCRTNLECRKLMAQFPPKSVSGVDPDYPADGVSLWACWLCERGIAVSW